MYIYLYFFLKAISFEGARACVCVNKFSNFMMLYTNVMPRDITLMPHFQIPSF